MPRRPSALALLLLALAAAPAAAQTRLTCAGPLVSGKHWDRLSTLLARKDSRGTLVITGPATLVPFRGLERLRDDDFRAEQAVAVLDLTADQGSLPRGRYCMTAQYTGSDPAALGAWSVRYYAVTQGRAAATPSATTRGLAYRMVDADDDTERPRPAARLHFFRRGAGVGAAPSRARPSLVRRVADVHGAARQSEVDEFYAVWYRCGNGCCGASLNF